MNLYILINDNNDGRTTEFLHYLDRPSIYNLRTICKYTSCVIPLFCHYTCECDRGGPLMRLQHRITLQTILMRAVSDDRVKMVHRLIQSGIDPYIHNTYGVCAVDTMIEHDRAELLDLFLSKNMIALNRPIHEHGLTPWLKAKFFMSYETIELFERYHHH